MDSDSREVTVLKNTVILCYRILSTFFHITPVYATSVYKVTFFFFRKSKKGDSLITICTKQLTSLLARLWQCLCLNK